jgi:heptosyltransferase-2
MGSFPSQVRKLLIRSTNWIGDAVMTTPAIRSIRRNFPDAEITILSLPWVADIFQSSPHVDRVFLYRRDGRHEGLSGKIRLAGDLRRERFDAAILLQNAFEAAFITFLARIPARGGYTTDGRGLLLTHGVKKKPAVAGKHQVHYYQEMLAGLGLTTGRNNLELTVPEESLQWGDRLLGDLAGGGTAKIIGLNPGAAYGPAKRWPAEKFADLAARICRDPETLILIFGTDADREAGDMIIATQADRQRVVSLCGRTTLSQAMALISRCRVFVTNDSGLMHVSAALQTPTVAVFGSTNHVTTGPYSDHAAVVRSEMDCSPCLKTHCPKEHFLCMENISARDVFSAVQHFLPDYRQR